MTLLSSLAEPSELNPATVDAMFVLMQSYYDNVRKRRFLDDLNSKDWVICLKCSETDELVGFSTQRLLIDSVAGETRRVLFSGDTIVDRRHWNSPTLAQAWGRFALQWIDAFESEPLYWLLLSKGYRTYRFLPLFFHRYAPAFDQDTSEEWKTILQTFVGEKYGAAFNSASGIVSGSAINKNRLRNGVGDITPGRSNDPHVKFFLECNPGHGQGDELCCIAPLTRTNFTRAAWCVIGEERVESIL